MITRTIIQNSFKMLNLLQWKLTDGTIIRSFTKSRLHEIIFYLSLNQTLGKNNLYVKSETEKFRNQSLRSHGALICNSLSANIKGNIYFLFLLNTKTSGASRVYTKFPRTAKQKYQPQPHFIDTAQKMKFSIKDLFIRYGQIRRKLWIWSYLLEK